MEMWAWVWIGTAFVLNAGIAIEAWIRGGVPALHIQLYVIADALIAIFLLLAARLPK